MVGVERLELSASWSQTTHATNCATPRCERGILYIIVWLVSNVGVGVCGGDFEANYETIVVVLFEGGLFSFSGGVCRILWDPLFDRIYEVHSKTLCLSRREPLLLF